MLSVLVASDPQAVGVRSWPARLGSALLHAGVVASAAWGTRPAPVTPRPALTDTTITWFPPQPPGTDAPGPVPSLPGRPGAPVVSLSVVPSDLPGMPDVPPVAPPGAPSAADPAAWPLVGRPAGLLAAAPPLDAHLADEPPALLEHPPVRYPEVLRQAGLTARIVVEAVLDTAGRVEPGSPRIVGEAHPLFTAEAHRVVLASRYRPARAGGRAVRVRIRVPVAFALRR